MIHLPPRCNFTVQPYKNPDPGSRDVQAESRLNSLIEKDDSAHCYRDHFLGQVNKRKKMSEKLIFLLVSLNIRFWSSKEPSH